MQGTQTKLLPKLDAYVNSLDFDTIDMERRGILQQVTDYIQLKKDRGEEINLNFICTHNSRRSQFAQIWGKVAASYHGLEINSFSGGVEVTAFNERAVECIKRAGFEVDKEGEGNPVYSVFYSPAEPVIKTFSKVFDDPENTASKFATIMTCAHADENCPFIPGAEARLPVRYDDPKAFDDTPEEANKYDERSRQIATELFYVFSMVE